MAENERVVRMTSCTPSRSSRRAMRLETDDVVVRSGHVRVRVPWGHDVPEVLRIEVSGKVGSGHFVARPKYRSFWQWLTRQPKPYEITA